MATSLSEIVRNVITRSYNATNAPEFSALIITYCNASEPCSFSRAYIDFKEHFVKLKSLAWFANGFLMVTQALKGNDAFKGEKTFENLKQIVRETKHLDCLKSLLKSDAKQNEAKVRNTLAAHYFQPLAYGSCCIIDRGSSTKCECCNLELACDDTSFGYPYIWHGRADIILKNSTIKIALNEDDGDDDDDLASGEPATKQRKIEESNFSSIVEVKLEKTDTAIYDALTQALAEGIVNAFCEAKRDHSLFKKFVPSFIATEKHIRIILYNCHSDILLLSDRLDIWNPDNATLNVDTLLLVWMALNFDNYEMKLDEKMNKIVKQSNFQNLIGDTLPMYIKEVSKPCPEYKPRNIGLKRDPPRDDGTFFLARQIEHQYYIKVLNDIAPAKT